MSRRWKYRLLIAATAALGAVAVALWVRLIHQHGTDLLPILPLALGIGALLIGGRYLLGKARARWTWIPARTGSVLLLAIAISSAIGLAVQLGPTPFTLIAGAILGLGVALETVSWWRDRKTRTAEET